MILKRLVVSDFQSNCFILGCEKTKEALVIDAGGDISSILDALKRDKLHLKYIVNTHGHVDHVDGNYELKEKTGAKLIMHPLDIELLKNAPTQAALFGMTINPSVLPDILIKEGDTIDVGEEIHLKVLHTPGHSPGGISLLLDGKVFVGDTLFAGSIGRTDLFGGSYETLIDSVVSKIFPLGDDTEVYPGHGPATKVGNEKKHNPFF